MFIGRRLILYCFLFFLSIGALRSQVCDGKKVVLISDALCPEEKFILDFEDNFDGSALDSSKWKIIYGVARDIEHTNAQQWYSPKNIEVSNGTLKLITKRDTFINQCYDIWEKNALLHKCEDFFFSAGEIDSKEKFSHGKFEMSCKLPRAKGVGSSFWTYGAPPSNEIDIFEFENEYKLFGQYDENKLSKVQRMNSRTDLDNNGTIEDCPNSYTGIDYSKDFHVFTLIWTPQKLEWYVDGVLKRRSTLFYTMLGQIVECNGLQMGCEYILNRAFPMNAMSIIVDNIVQSKDKAPDKDTPFPNNFEIDYIKFYRLVP
ncbi:glycoside hydrolase family 16 protein [Aurantibacillus circumpalustris]|uniref:glycoside hydrolase family 16 protein n=1 Tax=Aurantibacillus circumpalustris TaxID=3036359 RepID=UPI00295B47CE|nr:glycoside hydrolase family 16 protein [Aurantibacillus circumpalustris]